MLAMPPPIRKIAVQGNYNVDLVRVIVTMTMSVDLDLDVDLIIVDSLIQLWIVVQMHHVMVLKMILTVAVKTFLVKLAKVIAISIPNVRVELCVEQTIVDVISHQDLIVVEFVQPPTMMLTVVPQMV